MPTSIDLPHCSVAIVNRGPVSLCMVYNQKVYDYKKDGKPLVVPFEVAHKHFGYELRGNKLFRNTDQFYETGDQTAYYMARSTFLPWGWERYRDRRNFDHIFNPDDPEKDHITKARMLDMIRDTWENKIAARLIALPETVNSEQFEALPV